MFELLPPFWLIRVAVAAVWLYEGLWCKLLRGQPLWSLSAIAPVLCAVVQTVLLVTLNANGLLWSRHLIHDPAGMVVKNSAFLVLVWVGASLPGWS